MANANSSNSPTSQEKTTYSEMVLKQKIGPMINLPADGPWEIVSETENGLYMLHHKPDADLNVYGALRGVVVDSNVGKIVSYSFPHSPKIVANSLSLIEGKVVLNQNLSLDPEKIKIKPGFEGPLIHVFKHDGIVYHSTRKRFDCSRSRWGSSKTFGEMYSELSGPSDEVLFDTEKKYSPYCHTFIMVYPDMLVSTRDTVGKGYLIYLGPKTMYSTGDKCPYPVEEVDPVLRVPDTVSELIEGQIYSPQVYTLEEANKHLLFGFYDGFEGYEYLDPRLLPGEFVILEDTETGDMYRIESVSYNWRSEMRNNNPNLLHRFFELLDFAYLKNNEIDQKRYREKFPILTFYDVEHLAKTVEKSSMIVWPQNTETEFAVPTTRDTKLYNIWQCFLMSVPLCRQKEVVGYYNHLVERREEIVQWLSDLSDTKPDMTNFSKRVKDILIKTRMFAEDRVKKKQNIDRRTGRKKNVDEITKENIKNFISKEMGTSLYRILREMDRFKQEMNEVKTE